MKQKQPTHKFRLALDDDMIRLRRRLEGVVTATEYCNFEAGGTVLTIVRTDAAQFIIRKRCLDGTEEITFTMNRDTPADEARLKLSEFILRSKKHEGVRIKREKLPLPPSQQRALPKLVESAWIQLPLPLAV